MGFQEILRALPMTDAHRTLELEVSSHSQTPDYGELFKREFIGAGGAQVHVASSTTITQNARPGRSHRSLSHYLMGRADPLSASYPHERRDDLADYTRIKMLAFLNDPINVAALGRKKCYDAGYFFERPRPYLDRATPQHWAALSEVMTHMLGTKAVVLPEEAMSTQRELAPGTIALYGGRHKWLEESRI